MAQPEESEENKKIYDLSPFEVVVSENDIGYYTENTLAGSRMNSKLSDLAASITVVTAQQLEDTASIDINDIFLYEANTEGVHTYTAYSIDRYGGVTESVQMNPETSNRVRGIGSPDRATNYFVSISGIPLDAYNIESVTINRGPNSVLYGLGSAAGLINSSPMKARIGDDSNRINLRIGSWDEYRASFKLNRTLVKDKLAVAVAGLYHKRGFQQKPSSDITRRFYTALTYRPFEKTTLRFSYERYNEVYQRPNSTTPGDSISNWRNAGSPTFNPSTMQITHNGVFNPIALGSSDEVIAASGGGIDVYTHSVRPVFLVNNGSLYGTRTQRQIGATIDAPSEPEQLLYSTGPTYDSPLFVAPGISDKSIYDWDEINILSGNHGRKNSESWEVFLEQKLLDNLFLEVGARHERLESFSLNAQSGNQARIFVDVNETLLDGTANPYFLKTFIETWEPTAFDRPTDNDTYRASLAYELDFTGNSNWTRWFGRHNLMAMGQSRTLRSEWYRWRESVISDHDWSGDPGTSRVTGPNPRIRQNRIYYLGDNGVVNQAPGMSLMQQRGSFGADYPSGVIGQSWNQTLRHFVATVDDDGNIVRDGDSSYSVAGGRPVGEWVDEQAVTATILHDAQTSEEIVNSFSAVAQSYFLDEHIITTLGWRKDTRKARNSLHPDINEAGYRYNVTENLDIFPDEWDEVTGNTRTLGVVVSPFSFSIVPKWAQGIKFHYNESDTFSPAGLEQDLFLNPLELPTGTGKDYGFAVSLMDNKFVMRVNWYEAEQKNSRAGGSTTTITWRTRRVENEGDWGLVDMIEQDIESREDLPEGTLDAFIIGDSSTAPYLAEIAQRSGLSEAFMQQDVGFNDSRTIASEGMEISLNYNPVKNWNIKLTVAKQVSIESESAPATQQWIWGNGSADNPEAGSRLDVWQTIMFADENGNLVPWWTTEWEGMPSWGSTPKDWYTGVVDAPLRLLIATQGTPQPQVRKWRTALITNYQFADGVLNGIGIGGSLRWEDKASIGNYGITNPNSGIVDQYDPARPIYDDANYYVDLWGSYRTTILNGRVGLKIQLNVRDIFEDGGLKTIRANPDGSPSVYRIVQPRTFYLSSSFDF